MKRAMPLTRRRRTSVRVLATALTLAALATACSEGAVLRSDDPADDVTTTAPTDRPSQSAAPTSTTSTTTTSTTTTVPGGPVAPNGRRRPAVPADPASLAREIEHTERALRDLTTPVEARAELGHRNQVAYRTLGARPEWEADVLAALPADLAEVARAHAEARRTLAAMHPNPSDMVPAWQIIEPEPADALLSYYREAEAATGIEWEYLAAINLVETGFGRIRGLSVAGARGPMQFLPSTWEERGIGEGDIDDPHDSIQAAARYLVRRGGPADMPRALRGYNNSPNYVRAVSIYADLLRRDVRALHVLHAWEVHYLSAAGDLWLPVGYSEPQPVPVAEYLARAPWSMPV